ncbi:MAG: 6-phosphogluconolactonase [Polyangia bacterium]|jgi:6-phosphogluconolactonase
MGASRGLVGEQVVCPTPEAAGRALARRLLQHLAERLRAVSLAHLALSGGSSGALLCDMLGEESEKAELAWPSVHLWMVDERVVEPSDPRLNFAQLRDRLAPRLRLPDANLHPMPVAEANGAELYARALDSALAQGAHAGRLDAVVLGVGPDGHTASLFPHSPALGERQRRVVINDGPAVTPPRPRMTMTYPTLNSARLIAVLATGPSKRAPLAALAARQEIVGGDGDIEGEDLPIAGIAPARDARMIWYLDEDAAPPYCEKDPGRVLYIPRE